MEGLMDWIITGFSLVATVANIHKKRWAFGIWACTNTLWAIIDWRACLYAQSALFMVYIGLALWGLWKWR
jgi:hypothetical protein